MKSYKKATQTNKRKVSCSVKEGDKKPENGVNRKKNFKQVMKTPNGLKTFMSVLSDKEGNFFLIAAFKSIQIHDATPAPDITVVNFTSPDPATPMVGSLLDSFPDTSVKN